MCSNFRATNWIDDHWYGASTFTSIERWICASKTVTTYAYYVIKYIQRVKSSRTDRRLSHRAD